MEQLPPGPKQPPATCIACGADRGGGQDVPQVRQSDPESSGAAPPPESRVSVRRGELGSFQTCRKCGRKFTTAASLSLHLLKATPCDAPEAARSGAFKCENFSEKCNEVFASARSLFAHHSRVYACDDPTRKRCAIVGQVGSSFDVEIDDGAKVSKLKKAIKGEKPNDFKDIDADKLHLFLAKTEGGAWVTEADVKNGVKGADESKALDSAGAPLKLVGLSGTDVQFTPTIEDVKAKRTPVHVLVVVPKQDGTSNEMSAATTPLTVEQVEMSMNKVLRERDEKASAYSFSDLNTAMEERIVEKMRLTENIPDVKEPVNTSIAGYSWIPKIAESEESQRAGYMAYLQQHLKTLTDRGDFLLDDIAGDKSVLNIVDPRLPVAMKGTADV
ncbi:Crinkler (CRN) family protein [Phytophthora cinnamomi]|uniref:Crinkler (CRN) family protein n=1 Tax=Phytophthora cinnamomi TaxID=4785 RepID=UPI002B28974F|nr:Crinkler (CRN) family protein [Phytophthora cinnamomi]WNO07193.1 CRN effector protein [Phytophthora cinnamomi]